MERHDTMKRAARCLLGAGTFVAAMFAMGPGQAYAATQSCIGEAPTLCGHVYTETDNPADGYQVGEGTGNVTVVFVYTTTGLPAPTTGSNTSTTDCADV